MSPKKNKLFFLQEVNKVDKKCKLPYFSKKNYTNDIPTIPTYDSKLKIQVIVKGCTPFLANSIWNIEQCSLIMILSITI